MIEGVYMMNSKVVIAIFALFAIPAGMAAQSYSSSLVSDPNNTDGSGFRPAPAVTNVYEYPRPLSRVALGGGFSPLGVNIQAATNLNRFMNLRTTGNILNYSANNLSTSGFNINAKLNLASAGTSLDFYPFPNHGFRLSPGALIYNKNQVNALYTVQGGTAFSLNGVTYYTSTTNPVSGNGTIGLHTRNQAFTMTTGWGNVIPRHGGHWAFPVEVGAAFIGPPSVNLALTSGQVCDVGGQNCVNVATDTDVQANLQAQLAKYKSDLDALKTYPILSFGASYSFGSRSGFER
jgi:hypothetical protein